MHLSMARSRFAACERRPCMTTSPVAEIVREALSSRPRFSRRTPMISCWLGPIDAAMA